jgi:hypothetical protein
LSDEHAFATVARSARGEEGQMKRLVSMSVDELELLVTGSGEEVYELDGASYPPGCDPPRGPLRLRRLERGGLKVEVDKREVAPDDFRLSVLFYCGACVFANSRDLAEFLRGPVAAAFGIEAEPLPSPVQRPAEALLVDLTPRVRRRPKASRAKTARRPSKAPLPSDLARRLAQDVAGQEAAVERIADIVSGHLAKVAPSRPESILLLGPSGSGKTRAIQALPEALKDLGYEGAHIHRIDCGRLAGDFDASRVLGSAPGYVGYTEKPPLVEALERPGCILLLDEIEKAHKAVRHVFLQLIDEGRFTAPDGRSLECPELLVAMTSSERAEDLEYELADVPRDPRQELPVCRVHLWRCGWPDELIGRIGSIVVFDPVPEPSLHEAAESAIRELGLEYGLEIEVLPPVLADVVLDLADPGELGIRALTYAARDLLMRPLAEAAREGLSGAVALEAGPPPRVVAYEDSLF